MSEVHTSASIYLTGMLPRPRPCFVRLAGKVNGGRRDGRGEGQNTGQLPAAGERRTEASIDSSGLDIADLIYCYPRCLLPSRRRPFILRTGGFCQSIPLDRSREGAYLTKRILTRMAISCQPGLKWKKACLQMDARYLELLSACSMGFLMDKVDRHDRHCAALSMLEICPTAGQYHKLHASAQRKDGPKDVACALVV